MMIHYADGIEESRQERFDRLLPVMACPQCSGGLLHQENLLKCIKCDSKYPVRAWVPILLPIGVADLGAATISEDDRISRHPYSVSASDIIASNKDGLVLDLGAGGKLDRYSNVVQIDIFRYPAVDVVASADRLPFADNTFDAVVSQAVFEHLQYPEWAVAEIRRVLKVGGIAKIDTAFLQPEHGYPNHFFNATESGLRHWFRDFDIEWSGVEPFQQPKWALHWFLGVYLDYMGPLHAEALRSMSVGDLAEMLQRHASGETRPSDLIAVEALDSLPARFQRVLAAGVSVRAVNRPKLSSPIVGIDATVPRSVDREREMELLRAEQLLMSKDTLALQEQLQSVSLKADYLFQFMPSLDKSIVTLSDVVGPKSIYLDTLPYGSHMGGQQTKPFATIVVSPSSGSSLLDTFFSLVSQFFGGWQLLIILGKDAPPTLSGIALRLTKLDGRVKVHTGAGQADINGLVSGEYCLHLKSGASLNANALEEVVTAARFAPGIAGVSFDYERYPDHSPHAIQCHAQGPWGLERHYVEANACFFKVPFSASIEDVVGQFSHIPLPLLRLPNENERRISTLKAKERYLIEQNLDRSTDLLDIKSDSDSLARELRQLADDTGNYLSQFYPESRNPSELSFGAWIRRSLSRTLRNRLPIKWWQLIQQLAGRGRYASVPIMLGGGGPFATFLLEPKSATGLISTFFSLVHQSYTGWQLVLVENHDQSPAVRRAIFDFKALDARVVVVNGVDDRKKTEQIETLTRGEYCMQLTDGVTVRFHCLEKVVALARDNGGVDEIVCDYELSGLQTSPTLRCYNFKPSDQLSGLPTELFNGIFFKRGYGYVSVEQKRNTVYMPKVLFHISRWRS
jgi:SAM-dependent methyltransferase